MRIIKEDAFNRTTEIETVNEMSTVPAEHNKTAQAVMLKSMVLDSEWFYGNKIKFEDW